MEIKTHQVLFKICSIFIIVFYRIETLYFLTELEIVIACEIVIPIVTIKTQWPFVNSSRSLKLSAVKLIGCFLRMFKKIFD